MDTTTAGEELAPLSLHEFAAAVAEDQHDGPIVVRAGQHECLIEGDLARAVVTMITGVANGLSFDGHVLPEEITTGQAADLLGVSRPTVVALVDSGKIPGRKIGTHRRLLTADVLAYRSESQTASASKLDDLSQLSEELGLYGA